MFYKKKHIKIIKIILRMSVIPFLMSSILTVWFFVFQNNTILGYNFYINFEQTVRDSFFRLISHNDEIHLKSNVLIMIMFLYSITGFQKDIITIYQLLVIGIISLLFNLYYSTVIGFSLFTSSLFAISLYTVLYVIDLVFNNIYYKLLFKVGILIIFSPSLLQLIFDKLIVFNIINDIIFPFSIILESTSNYTYLSSLAHVTGFTWGLIVSIITYYICQKYKINRFK